MPTNLVSLRKLFKIQFHNVFVSQLTSCYGALCVLLMRTCVRMAEAAQAKGVEELPIAQHISHK